MKFLMNLVSYYSTLGAEGVSTPAASNATDAQPACTAEHPFLAARPAPQPTRCAAPSTALRRKPQTQACTCPGPRDPAAVANQRILLVAVMRGWSTRGSSL